MFSTGTIGTTQTQPSVAVISDTSTVSREIALVKLALASSGSQPKYAAAVDSDRRRTVGKLIFRAASRLPEDTSSEHLT